MKAAEEVGVVRRARAAAWCRLIKWVPDMPPYPPCRGARAKPMRPSMTHFACGGNQSQGFERRVQAADGRRPAAVAVVLLGDDAGRACFLLTRRAAGLRNHASSGACRAGALEPRRVALEAARR